MIIAFIAQNILLGAGLAMDAFSVSLANGLADPGMSRKRRLIIAGTYAFFQFAMPLTGWVLVRTVVAYFRAFERFVPVIALILLSLIGGNMLREGIRGGEEAAGAARLTASALLLQGIATSIDALSAGFALSEYSLNMALPAALLIAAVTYGICLAGLFLGRRFGMMLGAKAQILGGCILIGIGVEIFCRITP